MDAQLGITRRRFIARRPPPRPGSPSSPGMSSAARVLSRRATKSTSRRSAPAGSQCCTCANGRPVLSHYRGRAGGM